MNPLLAISEPDDAGSLDAVLTAGREAPALALSRIRGPGAPGPSGAPL